MFDACLPLGPIFASKVTFCPSARLLNPSERISEKCANRSSPPSSGVMKPKPFASLNHLTVPVAIIFPVLSLPDERRLPSASAPRIHMMSRCSGHDNRSCRQFQGQIGAKSSLTLARSARRLGAAVPDLTSDHGESQSPLGIGRLVPPVQVLGVWRHVAHSEPCLVHP